MSNEPLTEARLKEIEARADNATRGPWFAPLKNLGSVESFAKVEYYLDDAQPVYDFTFYKSFEAYPPTGYAGPIFVASSLENADFIAHAREDIPALVSELRRLQAESTTELLASSQAVTKWSQECNRLHDENKSLKAKIADLAAERDGAIKQLGELLLNEKKGEVNNVPLPQEASLPEVKTL
jgi:hypothetical protein